MKYYSEVLRKYFDDAAECEKAENEELTRLEKEKKREETKLKEKKTRASEIEKAYKDLQAAKKKYYELIRLFIEDYGSFHFTFSNSDDFPISLFETKFKFF